MLYPPLASPYIPSFFTQLWIRIKRYFTDREIYTLIGDDYSEDEND